MHWGECWGCRYRWTLSKAKIFWERHPERHEQCLQESSDTMLLYIAIRQIAGRTNIGSVVRAIEVLYEIILYEALWCAVRDRGKIIRIEKVLRERFTDVNGYEALLV
jgi:hypothetical protein